MNAAIYARKSTEQTGVSDEEKSVTRQIAHAKLYAAQKAGRSPMSISSWTMGSRVPSL